MKLKKAQEIVNEMCRVLGIPSIWVVCVSFKDDVEAEFIPNDYIIKIDESKTSEEDVLHEVSHYVIYLVGKIDAAEEIIVEAATTGLEIKIRKDYKGLNQLITKMPSHTKSERNKNKSRSKRSSGRRK